MGTATQNSISPIMQPQQELLLRAALLRGPDATAVWSELKRTVDFDAMDRASLRLLPLLYWNLRAQGVDDPRLDYPRKAYRTTWLRNRGFLRDLSIVLRAFERRGIDVMLLKGLAMALGYYPDMGLRPMHDVDILIRPPQTFQAIDILGDLGWVPKHAVPMPLNNLHLTTRSDMAFRSPTGWLLDLHWRITGINVEAEYLFWEGAEECGAPGLPARVMNPADQLFHTIAHNFKHKGEATTRAMSDSYMILVHGRRAMDWTRLNRLLLKGCLARTAREFVHYAQELVDLPLPDAVKADLKSTPPPAAPTPDLGPRISPPARLLGAAQFLADNIAHLANGLPRRARPSDALLYLKHRWGLERVTVIPRVLLAKAIHHAARRGR